MKQKALQIFLSGVNKVLPEKLIRSKLTNGDIQLSNFNKIYLIAVGKAAFLMAREAEEILGNRITDGLAVTKYGHGGKLTYLKVIEAGHPSPDENGIKATGSIFNIVSRAKEDDLVLCLISGGASALLPDYPAGTTLNDLISANNLLLNSGAAIAEINCVRKHLSGIKGGQLAKAIFPATTISLILSDVVGDQPDVIASGITAPDNTTFRDALEILNRYDLTESFPVSLINHLHKGLAGLIAETPKPGDLIFSKVENYIIGNNRIALEGAADKATELGFNTNIVTDKLEGDYLQVAETILKYISELTGTDGLQKSNLKPQCLLFGGEPTVKVTGSGKGGRNQHLALYLATKISGKENITILCGGTDGTDGPTDAAGAIVDGLTAGNSSANNIDPDIFLSNFDSYNFFKHSGDNIKTGNSGTNVMDLIVVLMEQNNQKKLTNQNKYNH